MTSTTPRVTQIARDAQALRVPMTHVTKDDEYLPVLAYRITQQIEAAEERIELLRELAARVAAESTETPKTSVTVFGPNLMDQSKGQFHVHAADCGDCKHYGRGRVFGGEAGWTIEVGDKLDVSTEIHGDVLSDYGLTPEDAAGREMLLDWLSDLWFAPCVTLAEVAS